MPRLTKSNVAEIIFSIPDVDDALTIFQKIQEMDPYRLDNIDIYSNMLFVKDMKREMAYLAHKATEINKYRPETCAVVGNYYSVRAEHQKAVTYFQRALRLNPNYLAAWTLIGHEFMEMKNTNAAIQSYRKAVGKFLSVKLSRQKQLRSPFNLKQKSIVVSIELGTDWVKHMKF